MIAFKKAAGDLLIMIKYTQLEPFHRFAMIFWSTKLVTGGLEPHLLSSKCKCQSAVRKKINCTMPNSSY